MKENSSPSSSSSSSSSWQQIVSSYNLPDDCWESIFRFILDEGSNNKYNKYYHNLFSNIPPSPSTNNKYNHYLNSLSLVSKQFLSITNRLLFSYTVYKTTDLSVIFKRFTNLNSLVLARNCFSEVDVDTILIKISCFPLKLTSLCLNCSTIPANGLRVFSKKITTLTSLTCSGYYTLHTSDLFLIAECFPLLQELDLSYPNKCLDCENYVYGLEALSLSLIKLRKVNLIRFPINDRSLILLFNNCKHLEEVILYDCYDGITNQGFAFALCERPTLKSLSFSNTNNAEDMEVFATSHFIESLVSLKSLTCLCLPFLKISDELLYSIARESLPLTSLDLGFCTNYSYNGIFYLLSKCQRLQHLNLKESHFLNDQNIVQLSLFLGDLVSVNLSWCDNLTKSTLITLAKNCPSLSEIKMERIKDARNSDSLGEFGVYLQLEYLYLGHSWLNDESIIMIASIFPNLQLLDLNSCDDISEGISEVLRKCCKIKLLNLASCSRVKLLGLNFAVPNLEVLNLSYTKVDDETLYLISKSCCGLLQLLLQHCNAVTKKGVKHVVEKCTNLRKIKGKHCYHLILQESRER